MEITRHTILKRNRIIPPKLNKSGYFLPTIKKLEWMTPCPFKGDHIGSPLHRTSYLFLLPSPWWCLSLKPTITAGSPHKSQTETLPSPFLLPLFPLLSLHLFYSHD